MSLSKLKKVNLLQTHIVSPQMDISIFILNHAIPATQKYQLFTAKLSEQKEYAPGEMTLLVM